MAGKTTRSTNYSLDSYIAGFNRRADAQRVADQEAKFKAARARGGPQSMNPFAGAMAQPTYDLVKRMYHQLTNPD